MGVGLLVLGLIIASDLLIQAYHLNILGFVMAGYGGFVLINGIIGLIAAFRENLGLIKTNMILSIVQVLGGITLIVLFMVSNKKVAGNLVDLGTHGSRSRSSSG